MKQINMKQINMTLCLKRKVVYVNKVNKTPIQFLDKNGDKNIPNKPINPFIHY